MNSIVSQRFLRCLSKLRELGKVRSGRQFALALDYLPQSLSEIQKGRRDVTIELIRKAVEEYKISPTYLFNGEGTMFINENDNRAFRMLTIVTDENQEERIIHVPAPAQAGYAGESVDERFLAELPSFTLPDYKYKSGTHRSFEVSGDSMEPTLFEGDKVVCSYLDPKHWESSIKNNYVYLIVTRGDVLIRRVQNLISNNKTLELHADNVYYTANILAVGDIREIWYVRSKISPFLPSPTNLANRLAVEIEEMRSTLRELNTKVEYLSEKGKFVSD
jgi:phage repressor protein C with HTH and peptisase S24 domain